MATSRLAYERALNLATLLAPLAFAMSATAVDAQVATPGEVLDLPGSRELSPPELDRLPRHAVGLQVLPPAPPLPEDPSLDVAPTFELRGIVFRGNTIFSQQQLAEGVASYIGTRVSTEQLIAIRNAITLRYVQAGYISSGARIPDQRPTGGILTIEVIEAVLGELRVRTDGRFRTGHLRSRIAIDDTSPINLATIEDELKLLARDTRIEAIEARVLPTADPRQSVLDVSVSEHRPYWAWAEGGTLVSPTIGGYSGTIAAGLDNGIGIGDRLEAELELADGLVDVVATYELMLPGSRGRAGLSARFSNTKVVAGGLRDLSILTRYTSAAAGFEHPIFESTRNRIDGGALLEWREARNYLAGEPTSFSEGARSGVSRVFVGRLYLGGVTRSADQVLSGRILMSVGIDALGATRNEGRLEDGRFVAGIGQLQFLRRLAPTPIEVLVRASGQLTNDPLLPMERFAIGGRDTVRGYRENLLVRDNGGFASLEFRAPLLQAVDGRRQVDGFVHVDLGHSWEKGRNQNSDDTVGAAGLGLRGSPFTWMDFEISWSRRFLRRPSVLDEDLQDDGLYFRVQVHTF